VWARVRASFLQEDVSYIWPLSLLR
jgi:hypothetical protein